MDFVAAGRSGQTNPPVQLPLFPAAQFSRQFRQGGRFSRRHELEPAVSQAVPPQAARGAISIGKSVALLFLKSESVAL